MKHSRRGICLIINVTIQGICFFSSVPIQRKARPVPFALMRWPSGSGLLKMTSELSAKEKMRVRRVTPRGGRLTNIKYIDVGVLREILTLADIRIKAFILVAACTGARIGELRALTWSCVTFPDRKKFPDKLTELYIPKSKNQSARRVWITREAEDALLAWKNNACSIYLVRAGIVSKNLGRVADTSGEKVFPFCVQSVYERWDAILKQLGYFSKDPLTRRNQLNFHRLRGFFKIRVLPVIGSEMSELALGHCDAYGHAYDGIPDGEMEKLFRKCGPGLNHCPRLWCGA